MMEYRIPGVSAIAMAQVQEAERALQESGKFIPWQVITISTTGEIID